MACKMLSIIVLLNVICMALCFVSFSQPSTHPDHPGKCWDTDTKKAYSPKEVFTVPTCTGVTCHSDFSFDYATCGVVGADPPCHVTDGDLTLPYPDCCPQIKCDK